MENVKVISAYKIKDELKEFGIIYLTSESCGYSMRALYDLTENAVNLLSGFFGGITFNAPNWNNKGVKSVMLSHKMLEDILIFCLLESGYTIVVKIIGKNAYDSHIRAYQNQDDFMDEKKLYNDFNFITYSGKNRNQHAFSGRTI